MSGFIKLTTSRRVEVRVRADLVGSYHEARAYGYGYSSIVRLTDGRRLEVVESTDTIDRMLAEARA